MHPCWIKVYINHQQQKVPKWSVKLIYPLTLITFLCVFQVFVNESVLWRRDALPIPPLCSSAPASPLFKTLPYRPKSALSGELENWLSDSQLWTKHGCSIGRSGTLFQLPHLDALTSGCKTYLNKKAQYFVGVVCGPCVWVVQGEFRCWGSQSSSSVCVCVEVGHCVLFTFTQDLPSKTEQGAERRETGKPPQKIQSKLTFCGSQN